MDQPDLFDVGERQTYYTTPGHKSPPCTPAKIGSGPDGETCKTCRHVFRNKMAKTYYKCDLMREYWTGGAGTDIRLRWPACKYWEPRD